MPSQARLLLHERSRECSQCSRSPQGNSARLQRALATWDEVAIQAWLMLEQTPAPFRHYVDEKEPYHVIVKTLRYPVDSRQ